MGGQLLPTSIHTNSRSTASAAVMLGSSSSQLQVEFVRRKHYAGSSASEAIGPVNLMSEEDDLTWMRSVRVKREIYGKDNRVAPGGRTPGIDAETAKKLVRKDEDIEPVFYWCYPYQFHEDLVRGLGPRLIVSLTVGDGAMALASLLLEKPFVGVALTQEHRAGVRTHLANCVFMGFMTEGSPFYDARIAQELLDAGVTKANVIEGPGGGAPGPKAKSKALPKAKAKAQPAPPAPPPPKAGAPKAKNQVKAEPKAKRAKAGSIADKMKQALAALNGGEEQDAEEDEDPEEDGDDTIE